MTDSLPLSLDVVLGLLLVAIGLGVLLARDLFQSIVLFIIFGMLMAVAWCRLDAVDVALAEAAIGAGVTGALLLSTLYVVRQREARQKDDAASPIHEASLHMSIARACAAVLFVTVLVVGLVIFIEPLTQSVDAPGIAIDDALSQSGVDNPVTAVLLSFRAYDTLLEVVVLLAAFLAARAAATDIRASDARPISPVLGVFARLLVPLAVVVSAYMLWIGTKEPGGAFQSAAILAAAGVLMVVCGFRPPNCARRRWRVLLVGGPSVFLLVGLSGIATGGRFLELPSRWSGALILLIETALTGSISLILVLLFSDASPSLGQGASIVSPESGQSVKALDAEAIDTQESS